MPVKPRRYPKKPTRAQRAVVPAMMEALDRAATRTLEEIEKDIGRDADQA